jgi:hypothetical protein
MFSFEITKPPEYWTRLREWLHSSGDMGSIWTQIIPAVIKVFLNKYPNFIHELVIVPTGSPDQLEKFKYDICKRYCSQESKSGAMYAVIHVDTTSEQYKGKLDTFLSPNGNVIYSVYQHSLVVSKQADGNYMYIDPMGSEYVSEDYSEKRDMQKRLELLKFLIPEGRTVIESPCIFQSYGNNTCFLWSLLFLAYPKKTPQEILSMVEGVGQRNGLTKEDHDLVILAIMDNFVTNKKGGRRKTKKRKTKKTGIRFRLI